MKRWRSLLSKAPQFKLNVQKFDSNLWYKQLSWTLNRKKNLDLDLSCLMLYRQPFTDHQNQTLTHTVFHRNLANLIEYDG